MNSRSAILNPRLAAAVVGLGHTQSLWIVDAGFPVPIGVDIIDVSVCSGVPSFAAVFVAVAAELAIESATVAVEARESGTALIDLVGTAVSPGALSFVTHEELKQHSHAAHVIVRTGETTPYMNVCLTGGVTF